MAQSLLVRILGDATSLTRSLDKSATAANQFGAQVSGSAGRAERSLTKLQRVAAGGFIGGVAAGAAIQQLRASVDVASNLNEQMARANVVFGSAADSVVAWSETTANAMGIAQDEALAAAGTFGAMFDQAGQTEAAAARLSQRMVTLASDLASFNNASIEDTLTAIRSGLSGEIEPLRRFQVFLTEAAVSQRAMTDSGKDSVQQLTQGEKILARYNLILEQTGKQQGDYARTSESLANTQRRLSAQIRDLQADIGGVLLPAVARIVNVMSDATQATKSLGDALEALGSIRVPVINIPINFELPGTGGRNVTDIAAEIAKQAGPFSFFFRTEQILNLLFPDRDVNPDTRAAAKAFEDQFNPFFEGAEQGRKRVADKAKAFGQKGFKPLPDNQLGEKLQKQFDNLIDTLDVRLDRARLTRSTADDLAALDAIETAVNRRIAVQGRTNDLLRQLVQVQAQRQSILDDVAAERKASQEALTDALFGRLELAVDRAALTRTLRDDLRALTALQNGLREQIRKGGDIVRFQQQLVTVTQDIAATRRAIEEAAGEALQARQFRALGLSATGDELLPGITNLRRQFEQLSGRVLAEDVPRKLRDRLARVGSVLAGEFGTVTDETKQAILDLFREIRSTFDRESRRGPLTRTTSLRANKLLAGLGLDTDEIKELRARLSSFNSAGLALAGTTRPTGSFNVNVPVIENHTTVELDGQVVGRSVTRNQQKNAKRNPVQKRGSRRGGV